MPLLSPGGSFPVLSLTPPASDGLADTGITAAALSVDDEPATAELGGPSPKEMIGLVRYSGERATA